MTTEAQKEIEMHYAKNAATCLGEAWEISSAPNELEWPDLLIKIKDKEFGLEIREVYPDESRKGSIKKTHEIQNIKKLKAIAEKYYQSSDVSIKVKLLGSIDNETHIIEALNNVNPNRPDFDQVRLKPYQGCVMYVTKLPSTFEKYTEWVYVSDRVGYVGELSDDLVQEKINEKSTNLNKYSKNIDDIRLLLVCNPAFNSGRFEYSQTRAIDHNGFKEIYFLSNPNIACKINS